MAKRSYQEILNFVTSPSQYLGTEVNSVKKDLDKVDLKIALAFPDLYEIGTSHFGIQILYSILNRQQEIAAERVFCPAVDMQRELIENNIPLLSLESSMPLKNFDIVGFSLLYELNYSNVLTMLRLSNIPFFSERRNENDPMIIAGGPCACNPEPVARLFDAVVFGDGEEVCLEMAKTWIECKRHGTGKKEEILDQWRTIEGVYVPSFFDGKKIRIGNRETVIAEASLEDYKTVSRRILKDLNQAAFPEKPIVAFGKPVHDRLRIEIARGCTRGCRFCQAGTIYRPVRERDADSVYRLAEKCLCATGYEDISLLSLSTGDYSRIEKVLRELMEKYSGENIAVSLPSLRAGTLTRNLMESIKKVRKTGFTIAPEAGSQRLRDVINKNVTQDQIFETIEDAVRAGWKVIKLYFMVGLPTETDEDLRQTAELIKRAASLKGSGGRKIKINASFTTFIPKPHTPFQWAGQASLEYSRESINLFRDELHGRGVQVKWQNPETSKIEGLFARGDRGLAELLVKAFENGCRLDGWSDHFRYDLWEKSAEETGIDIDFFTGREREFEEPLPWDHMDSGIKKSFLLEEWKRASERACTVDCREGECQGCGVCDFVYLSPILAKEKNEIPGEGVNVSRELVAEAKKIVVNYSKTGKARFFGHLEMVNLFLRAMRRAKVPVVYSGGFHPMPKVSFEDPLPLGMESLKERFVVSVRKDFEGGKLPEVLNALLPDGLILNDCEELKPGEALNKPPYLYYSVELSKGELSEKKLKEYETKPEFMLRKKSKKGKIKEIDLKKAIEKIVILNKNRVLLKVVNETGKSVRPSEILESVFGISQEAVKQARVLKLDARKDSDVQTTGHKRF